MTNERFSRTKMLLGEENMEKLKCSRIAIFGLGGVGGHCAEALARCGVGHLSLIDNDTVSVTNINRQLIALSSTVGRLKTEVMRERILDINPDVDIKVFNTFYLPENADSIPLNEYDFIIDAIDTVSAKVELALRAQQYGINIISSMGTGNKTDPTKLTVTDIYKTEMCPLARVMRRELKNRGVKALKVVYSNEKALTPVYVEESDSGRNIPGSTSFVPSVAGLIIASQVVNSIIDN